MHAVAMKQLSKIYAGGKTAVADMSLTLEPGEVFGFLGPNGAGKTTTVKVLNGMLQPSAGECLVFGEDPARNPEKVHALSGVMTEHAQMYNNLTGMQNLVFYGSVFGIGEAESRKRAGELLRQLELAEAAGQKLLHRPKILFLDEPTSGLDPESAHNVNQMILTLAKEQGMTIFLCTHQLRYAQEICSRYGLIDEGRLLTVGTLEELRDGISSGMRVRIQADRVPDALLKENVCYEHEKKKTSAEIINLAAEGKGTEVRNLMLEITSEDEIPRIVRQIVEGGGKIYHVSASRPSLEDIYFALTVER